MIAKKSTIRTGARTQAPLAPLTRDELKRVSGGLRQSAVPFGESARRYQVNALME